jgi:hypothetical protein
MPLPLAFVDTIYSAMLTRDTDDSGSRNPIVIIGNQRFQDKFQITIEGVTPQRNRDQGQANLYIDKLVNPNCFLNTQILGRELSRSYFRVGIRGNDLWRPESFFMWGTAEVDGQQLVVPLALGLNFETHGVTRASGIDPGTGRRQLVLSTDSREGGNPPVADISFSLPPVVRDDDIEIRGLLFVMLTAAKKDSGTKGDLKFTIQTPNGELAFDIPNTSQDDHATGQANFYGPEFFPIPTPFRKVDLANLSPDAIRLFIGGEHGDDAWLPEALYLFGLSASSQPFNVAPLVHLEGQPVGVLSTQSSEGLPNVPLPLVPFVP